MEHTGNIVFHSTEEHNDNTFYTLSLAHNDILFCCNSMAYSGSIGNSSLQQVYLPAGIAADNYHNCYNRHQHIDHDHFQVQGLAAHSYKMQQTKTLT